MKSIFKIRFLACLLALSGNTIGKAAELPLIIAHRGASANAPENTMTAFKLAWEEGADGIEGDFFLSSDGEVVCIHDGNTKKTSSGQLDVGKSTLAQLRKLDYGQWKDPKFEGEQIPTLEQVLDAVPTGKWFLLEIKDSPEIVGPIARILRERSADKPRTVLISFDQDVIRECGKQLPEYRSCLLSSLKKFSNKGFADKYLAEVRACGSQGLFYKESPAVPQSWLTKARGEKGLLGVWTVNQLAPALRASQRGVDFLITDRPAGLRAELEASFEK